MASRTYQSSRLPRRPRRHPLPHHSVFALLWLDSPSASALRAALEEAGLHPESLLSSYHLTVYHARRSGPAAGADALALYDDNRNGRITCKEARRHGIAPVPRSHPAYRFMRDGDGDGIVCE